VTREAILYVSDQATNVNSVLAALKATGDDVVSTNSSTQAIALLFLMHSAAAVVLYHTTEQASFDIARGLRAIRPKVPIIVLCRDKIDPLPACVDVCVSLGLPLDELTSAVRRLLTAKRAMDAHRQSDPLKRAS